MEHRIVCCRCLDNEESRHTKIGGILNVVLEKNVQDQLQRTCHQRRSTFKGKRKRCIIARITNQQKLWIGHNLRHPDNLLTLAIEGRFIGKRGQGRNRCTFLDRLKSGEDYCILKRRAEDRDRWRNWKPIIE